MDAVPFVPIPSAIPLTPRPAATAVIVRDAAHGPEVLLVRRAADASFIAGAFVFPGGAVDADDHHLGRDTALRMAALRECFEECGLLLATRPDGSAPAFDDAAVAARFAAHRQALHNGTLSWRALCEAEGLRPSVDALVWLAHWITPIGAPRRFDTAFFLAPAPAGQLAAHDGSETTDHVWIRPADALARHRAGDLHMVMATMTILDALSAFDDAAAMFDHACAQPAPRAILPRVATGAKARQVLLPDHPAYAEVGRLDTQGHGLIRSVIVPGELVALSDRVQRLTAPNPGVMTGPGTNTYLLDAGDGRWVVLDPGPDDPLHIERILAATQGALHAILVTHDHSDHRPGALRLHAATGAPLVSLPRRGAAPDPAVASHVPADGELLRYGTLAVRALHTPGHASSHVCFVLPEERLMFSGDHVMQGSTVVIAPPDGNLQHYLQSLEQLLDEPLDWIAPGHGFLMAEPHAVLRGLIAHRLQREAAVLDALVPGREASIDTLRRELYSHTPAPLHGAAARMLLAHLHKLEREGRVAQRGELWRSTSP